MRRLASILFLFITFSSFVCLAQVDRDEKLKKEIEKYGQAEVVIPYPGRQAMDVITRNVSITSVRDKSVYITLSALTLKWFLDSRFDYEIIQRDEGKGVISAGSVKQAMQWNCYPTYSQYDSIMQKFQSDYPSLCKLDTIGTSVNGRLVLALKISDNASVDEDEPDVFYSSTIHGDEIGGFVLMLRLADYLLNNYSSDTRVRNMVDNLEIWINPLANPDGTYRTGDVISNPVRANANGYDLNRNFPDPVDDEPVKQKETVDMIKFMRQHHFVLSANFHAGSEVVNYPWDRWLNKYHADNDWFYHISRKYADTVHRYSESGYMTFLDNGVTRGSDWYVISGGRQDFITWELQGREVTIELDNTKLTPASQLELLWQYNRRSLLGYLENALYGIHGTVVDYDSGKPVAAKIYIPQHDKDSSHVYADTTTGNFIRLLYPGTWNLLFTAEGYNDTVITAIDVIDNQKTELTVCMKQSGDSIEKIEKPLLFPNPSLFTIECRLPDKIESPVRVTVINIYGKKVMEFISNERPVTLDVRGLSAGVYIVIFTSQKTGISFKSRFIVPARNF
ncbi:MAG: T9SS type A sorting domain-containing protein [Bacteroidales bacterium]|nr:T9SS type A sorting domain-containing protein [Bacteroidales bacterium]